MSRTVQILEYATSPAGKPLRVDREKCVIYGCKVLGEKSQNPPPHDNDYPRATREAAIAVLEGARSFVNHGGKGADRSYGEQLGRHRNLAEGGDGLYSEFHYNPKHALAEQLLWDAEHSPDSVAFSINANGKSRSGPGGRQIIEAILPLPGNSHSIDLVCRGGTTRGLNEGLRMTTAAAGKKTRKQVISERLGAYPKLQKWIREWADDGMDAAADEPPPGGAGEAMPTDEGSPGHGKELFDAIGAMIDKAMEGTDAEVLDKSYRKKLEKIKALLGADKGGDSGGDADKGGDVATEESLKAKIANLERKDAVRTLCESLKFTPTPVQLKALLPLDDADAKALIESFQATPAAPTGQKPRSWSPVAPAGPAEGTKPVREQQQQGAARVDTIFEGADTAKKCAAFLRSGKVQ